MTTLTREADNLWASVDTHSEDLERLLRFRPSGYRFAPSYQKCRCGVYEKNHENVSHPLTRRWDGWISLVRHRGGVTRIPAGLIPLVLEQPWTQNWNLVDQRTVPEPLDWYSKDPLVDLEPHQVAAVEAAIETGQGIVDYPTGTGKSFILGEIIRRRGVSALVLCDKIDLMKQLEKELGRVTGFSPGTLGGGRWNPKPLTVSTFQTISRRLNPPELENDKTPAHVYAQKKAEQKEMIELLKGFDAILVDEGHHAQAKAFEDILVHVPAYYRMAFSATPFKSYKGKSKDLGIFLRVQAFTGPPVAKLTISEGLETGRIVRPDIFMVEGCNWEGSPINFKEEYVAGIVENEERNRLITNVAAHLSRKSQTVILVTQIEHGRTLQKLLDEQELNPYVRNTPFLYGESKDRDEVYTAFRNQELKLLILSTIADEGLDLPNITTEILAGGGNSPAKQRQRIGRGLRASEGKTRVRIFDFLDKGKYLAPQARRRRRTYKAEPGYTVIDITKEEIEAWLLKR